ncbi:MAG: U-box domain-containing protein [Candidatus Protochlamydia sp.]|nr:U-box domain-containing protein [Candidatus Protochlamydia sp.]
MNLDIHSFSSQIKPLNLSQEKSKPQPPYSIVCSISGAIMEDPVIDPHGHSFDKKFIQEWLHKNNTCPLNQGFLTEEDLRPNRALKEIIEWYHSRGFDLTPRLTEKNTIPIPSKVVQNDLVAEAILKTAQDLYDKGQYDDAEKLYLIAITYTCKSEHYALLPALYEKKGDKGRAASAYLILADLQQKEMKFEEEIKTLEKSIELVSSPLVIERLGHLYKVGGQVKESAQLFLDLSQQALYNGDKSNALRLCHQSLEIYPGNKETWKILSALQDDSKDSIKILFKGANENALTLKERMELCKLIITKDSSNLDAKFHLYELNSLKTKEKFKQMNDAISKLANAVEDQNNTIFEFNVILAEQSKLGNIQLIEKISILELGSKQLKQEVELISSQIIKK